MMITSDVVDDIEKQLEKINCETLVVFDCDEVLTTLSEQIWRSKGREFLVDWCKRNVPEFNIPELSREAFFEVVNTILVSNQSFLVNRRMPEIVDNLRARGIKAIVLTALSSSPIGSIFNPVEWRLEILKNLGYDFKNFWNSLPRKVFAIPGENHFPTYDSGVICCDDVPKGKCLEAFLKYAGMEPRQVIFIDDVQENLDSVGEFCHTKDIDFVGIQYLEADKMVPHVPFSEELLEYQLCTLKEKKIWITDIEGKQRIQQHL
jgi:FMN phosphatase YigB (HAD superfamily)